MPSAMATTRKIIICDVCQVIIKMLVTVALATCLIQLVILSPGALAQDMMCCGKGTVQQCKDDILQCGTTPRANAGTGMGNGQGEKDQCPKESKWPKTDAGANFTAQNICYGRTIPATRSCNCEGKWTDYACCVPSNFSEILEQINESPREGIKDLSNTTLHKDVSLKQRAYLLRRTAEMMKNRTYSRDFFKEFLDTSRKLMTFTQFDEDIDINDRKSIGTQLLQTLDEFALDSVIASSETVNMDFENSIVTVLGFNQTQRDESDEHIVGILADRNCITVPREVIGNNITGQARIVSFIHYNVSTLLPPGNAANTIVSPIISTTSTCQSCINETLNNNVTLMLRVENATHVNGTLSCIFFEIQNLEDGEFPTGEWDNRGCSVTSMNDDEVNCSCNHLTHFAILLSPGTNQSAEDLKVLNVLGEILVPISLVCLVLIILIYTLIRSLWSMRNYIHIMLCVNLFLAQLVFVIGVERTENERICSGIAVLLQYLFLVTFMWMLMEGVVLYVTLVTVFIKNHHYYIIGFTVASYGIPALYMAIVVPIGFLVGVDDIPGHTHYLYYINDQLIACWLNYETYFIWTFIGPVIVILLINICFFVMALYIIRKHSKSNNFKKSDSITLKHWLKVSVSLTVMMGITWFAGVLVFREELLFIAYIMTIFIAGQGVVFFIILVPFSKQVRDALLKVIPIKDRFRSSAMVTRMSRVFSSSNNTSTTAQTNSHIDTSTTSDHYILTPTTNASRSSLLTPNSQSSLLTLETTPVPSATQEVHSSTDDSIDNGVI